MTRTNDPQVNSGYGYGETGAQMSTCCISLRILVFTNHLSSTAVITGGISAADLRGLIAAQRPEAAPQQIQQAHRRIRRPIGWQVVELQLGELQRPPQPPGVVRRAVEINLPPIVV